MIKRLLSIAILSALVFAAVSTAFAEPTTYVVEPGDTLWDISIVYGVDVDELAYMNGIKNPDLLQPGQVIILHGDSRDAVAYAIDQVGKPYVYGGNGPYGYDCSGLVQQAYLHMGVRLPRTADAQYGATARIDKPSRGDLVFYSCEPDGAVMHVALAISDTMMVHAYGGKGGVETRSIRSLVYIVGYGRVTE